MGSGLKRWGVAHVNRMARSLSWSDEERGAETRLVFSGTVRRRKCHESVMGTRLLPADPPAGKRFDKPLSPALPPASRSLMLGHEAAAARPGERARCCSQERPQLPPTHAAWPSAPGSSP